MSPAAATAKFVLPAFLVILAGAASAQNPPKVPAPRPLAAAPPAPTPPAAVPVPAVPSVAPKAGAAAPPRGTAPASTSPQTTAPPAFPPTPPEPAGSGERTTIVDLKGHDISPLSMFLAADLVVKAVICGLLAASFATWTVLFAKSLELFLAMRRLRKGLGRIGQARTLRDACELCGSGDGPLHRLLAAAVLEERLSQEADAVDRTGIKARAASCSVDITRTEGRAMRRGMGFLATVGSTGPFVGLFGTVWGIMNSFIGISNSQTTNLAVVAPGIAEALLATAIGLVTAIPAVVIYNHFSRWTRSYLGLLARAASLVERLLSRDLDRVRSATRSQAAE